MRYELTVAWSDGARSALDCNTQEQVEETAQNMYTAFGEQIAWTCMRDRKHTEEDGMKYDLIVVWSDGDRDVLNCDTQEQARQAAQNMYTAFGRQIAWTCIREAR